MRQNSSWNYQLSESVDKADWEGRNFHGLRQHFHDETQICVVRSGQRSFQLLDQSVILSAGDSILIPKGIPHTALPQEEYFSCQNFYLREPINKHSQCLALLTKGTFFHKTTPLTQIVEAFQSRGQILRGRSLSFVTPFYATGRVEVMAASVGHCREHFSRRFKDRHGLPPKTAELIGRLNTARENLRLGKSPAQAAYESSFSDQSHMSRYFKAFFGANPGAFARGLKSSQ